MATVHWFLCQNNNWCPFTTLDLSTIKSLGVYIIGSGRATSIFTVYVGQGDVAARIAAHRGSPDITAHGREGPLVVTWASVAASESDGVEAYVAAMLKPMVGSQHPNATHVPVNLPAGWV